MTAPTITASPLVGSKFSTTAIVFGGLAIALLAMVVVSAGNGQLDIPAREVIGSICHRLGLEIGAVPAHPQGEAALWHVRFPRIVMGIIVGASLATAGTLMQGVFGNPLAEPGVVGVSAGAAVAAASAIAFGISIAGNWTIPLFAFFGGLFTTLLVYAMSREAGRTEVVTLVLTGIAVNAVANAGLAFTMFVADTQAREQIIFWTLGSLNGSRWQYVALVAPLCGLGIAGALFLSRQLDLLSLGDRAARHVGIDVERLRLGSIVLVALLTAAAVSFSGIIGFVGLVVPHLLRIVLGPGHRALLPASALGGALLLVSADLAARTLVPYADLPLGMLTALVGGPFFFWLLRRTRRTAGGWS
jgi:iron complex transport system permease protein